MKPYQKRVVQEKKGLDAKREKLGWFIGDPKFDSISDIEQSRLLEQRDVMAKYSRILADRIAAFED